MDLSTFKELAPAGMSIVVIGYICFRLIRELSEARVDYRSYVQENNHTTTELVKEATRTMVEVKNSIVNHNDLLKLMIEKQK